MGSRFCALIVCLWAAAAQAGEPPEVRVLLEEGVSKLTLQLPAPFAVMDAAGEQRLGLARQPFEGPVQVRGGRLMLGTTPLKAGHVRLVARAREFRLGKRRYQGFLLLRATTRGRIEVVNHVDLERYVTGVVGNEVGAGAPAAALGAQAVAARTYALARLGRKGRWDLYDDSRSQVYRGLARVNRQVSAAVASSRGVVLTHGKGKLLTAFYSSTCGGRTSSAASVFGSRPIGPLGGVACGFCTKSPHYRWKKWYSARRLGQLLGLGGPAEKIAVTAKDGAGRAVRVLATGPGGKPRAFKASKIRKALDLKSTRFRFEGPSSSGFTVRGGGWGHGVGMCQYGAIGMARQDRDWRRILLHYYPGAVLTRKY